MGVILRRGAYHRRAADVDQLDARVSVEGVEVDDDELDRLDAVSGEIVSVRLVVDVGEDPTMDLRVQRHDAMAEDGREAGEFGDISDGEPGVGDRPCRAPARQKVPAESVEVAGELGDSGLVVHGEQGKRHEIDCTEPPTLPGGWCTRCQISTNDDV